MRPADARKLIKGIPVDWEVVIGMEVHAQVSSNAKLFSGASTRLRRPAQRSRLAGGRGHAGMQPVINKECVAQPCVPASG